MNNNYKDIDVTSVMWPNDTLMAESLREYETVENISVYYYNNSEFPETEEEFVEIFRDIANEFSLDEGGIADKLVNSYSHILRSVIKTNELRSYDPTQGIWIKSAGLEDISEDRTYHPYTVFDYILSSLQECAIKSYYVLYEMCKHHLPVLPRPSIKDPLAYQIWQKRDTAIKECNKLLETMFKLATTMNGKSKNIIFKNYINKVALAETAWDNDMRWLVCDGGTIDLNKIRYNFNLPIYMCVAAHSPEHMATNKCDARIDYLGLGYDLFDDTVPDKSLFLTGVTTTLPDSDVRSFLQARFGVALYGTPGEFGKSLVWAYGPSDTAKSSIQEVIAGENGVFGQYSWTGNATVLSASNGIGSTDTEANRFKAKTYGKRFVLFNEMDDGMRLSQSKVKSFTGGDTTYGDFKYGSEISFRFSASLFIASNHGPRLPDGDLALASRIIVLPFDHHYIVREKSPELWEADPDNRANPNWVSDVLNSEFERSMVLLWVLEGARNYFSRDIGKALPDKIKEAGESFKNNADIVSQTVQTMLGLNPDADGIRPSYDLLTKDQWEAFGHSDRDGVFIKDFKRSFKNTKDQLGITEEWIDKQIRKYSDLAVRFATEKYPITLKHINVPGEAQPRKVLIGIRPHLAKTDSPRVVESDKFYRTWTGDIRPC